MPRAEQFAVPVPLTVMVRSEENCWPFRFTACTVRVWDPAGMSMYSSIAFEPTLRKTIEPSTSTCICCTLEEEVVPATMRAGDGVVVCGEQMVTEGSTLFRGQ